MSSDSSVKYNTPIDRFYIDTRPYVPQPSNPKSLHTLPLLSTLQFSDQESVTRFIRPADRFMSLASAMLKYYFIHHRAKIPWSQVQISRTPQPHRRPYWEPPENWSSFDDDTHDEIRGLEFNVSHQAGLVAIIGCSTPTAQLPTLINPFSHMDLMGHSTPPDIPGLIRLGVDIACTNEDKRTPKNLTTQAKLDEWIEIFSEMFSDRERRHMCTAPIHMPIKEREEGDWGSGSDDESNSDSAGNNGDENRPFQTYEANLILLKLRRFYAYWSLKEAYIKMVGEGLLASWLRELEFLDVVAPPPPPPPGPSSRRPSAVSSRPLSSIGQSPSPGEMPTLSDMQNHRTSISTPSSEAQQGKLPSLTIPASDLHRDRDSFSISSAEAQNHRKSLAVLNDQSSNTTHLHPTPMTPTTPGSTTSSTHGSPLPLQRSASPVFTTREIAKWTPPDKAERGMTTLCQGHRVEDVDLEIVAYDEDFLVATAIKGVHEPEPKVEIQSISDPESAAAGRRTPVILEAGRDPWESRMWRRLDIEYDIRPCAEGRCRCLEER